MAAETQADAIIAAKGGLVDLLAADAALAGVQVSWGSPGKSIERETVIVGNVDPTRQEAASLGDDLRDARFTIAVAVNVLRRGTARETSERAAELATAVERVIRANHELGAPGTILFAQVASAGLVEDFRDESRESELPLTVAVRARLRRS